MIIESWFNDNKIYVSYAPSFTEEERKHMYGLDLECELMSEVCDEAMRIAEQNNVQFDRKYLRFYTIMLMKNQNGTISYDKVGTLIFPTEIPRNIIMYYKLLMKKY